MTYLPELARKSADQETAASVARAGWELVKDRLSAGRMAESYEQLHRKVIENAALDERRHVG
jgi:hypothetical protein